MDASTITVFPPAQKKLHYYFPDEDVAFDNPIGKQPAPQIVIPQMVKVSNNRMAPQNDDDNIFSEQEYEEEEFINEPHNPQKQQQVQY